MARERYEVGLHDDLYVVMDRDALRVEDMIVGSFQLREFAQAVADYRNSLDEVPHEA